MTEYSQIDKQTKEVPSTNNNQSCTDTSSSKEKSTNLPSQLVREKTSNPTCSTQAAQDTTLSLVPIKSKLNSQPVNKKDKELFDENRPFEYRVDEMFTFADIGEFPERIYVIGTIKSFNK